MVLPDGFLKEISNYPELIILKDSLLSVPDVSVRFNTKKSLVPAVTESSRVPWCQEGVYLPTRPQFTFDPSFHQGRYYVQDASSMAITAVIRQLANSPVRYLDACAAPGGKTTCALSVLPEESLVVANEFDYKRAEILAENVAKWGNPNVVVCRGETRRFTNLPEAFDIVAVDAPCSGEGMMRKDVHAVEQWSEGLVRQCASLQREILGNVWASVRPGGYLIYSTCTFNRTENEDNVKWLIEKFGAETVRINALESIPEIIGGIDCDFHCYRFIPGKVRGEGLFLAVVRKKDSDSDLREKKQPAAKTFTDARLTQWTCGEVEFIESGDEIFALPQKNASFMKSLYRKLDIISSGVHVATKKGKDLIPAHELALSSILNKEAFPTCELHLEDAILFLQRGTLSLPSDSGKGFVLLTYDGVPLGFVKNLGSRANNLLPKAWSIKSTVKDYSTLIKVI